MQFLLILTVFSSCNEKPEKLNTMHPLLKAPEINTRQGWVNVEEEYSIKDFQGKIVLLDFWTYGCINCQHIVPDLQKLEDEFKDALVIIGVHSAKFDSEKGTEKILRAIERFGIQHPVINDADFKIWEHYGIHAWPTVVLINPNGKIIGQKSGENFYGLLRDNILKIKKDFGEKINTEPIKFTFKHEHDELLKFPSKLAIDESGNLYISDSGHDRILIVSKEGKITGQIGSGNKGFKDGSFDHAHFFEPRGLAIKGHRLYIADTKNNRIRKADLDLREVTTISGSGERSYYFYEDSWDAPVNPNSPWDLVIDGNKLYIASAGNHQILLLDMETNQTFRFAGNGREALLDETLHEASFNQPSGLARIGQTLLVADAEASAIRKIRIDADKVETLVGKGLFDFGDEDGQANKALLQHCEGIEARGNKIYIADTYNGKIKVLDLEVMEIQTLVEGLNEPQDVAIWKNLLYITDSNNHRIMVYNLEEGVLSKFKLVE
ncbi:MAG: thioredoxin-like domain-containing protein [Cytophagaceae bacterium]